MKITEIEALDIRFPTSRNRDGSDAMNPDPDYSAAYAIVHTDAGLEGHGFTFTIGRGNEVCVAAIEALAPLVAGRPAEDLFADLGEFWRRLTGDSQLRWIGPEKGVIHLATAALVNAVWDLYVGRGLQAVCEAGLAYDLLVRIREVPAALRIGAAARRAEARRRPPRQALDCGEGARAVGRADGAVRRAGARLVQSLGARDRGGLAALGPG